MIILGLNIFHGDSSACFVSDNKLFQQLKKKDTPELNTSQVFQ